MLMANRLTFALGAAIGLGALLAAQRGRAALATALAALSGLGSPVAAVFVAIAGGALAVSGRRRLGALLAIGALAPVALLGLAFPTGGYFPFVFTAFLPVPLFAAAAFVLLPPEERVLRAGILIYAGVCVVLFIVHTQVGANAARLGSLFGGPVLALGLAGRRPVALAIVALPLLWWQWVAPVRDFAAGQNDPSVTAAYYQPLIDELDQVTGGGPVRIEIPPTRNRYEANLRRPALSPRPRVAAAVGVRRLRPLHRGQPHSRLVPRVAPGTGRELRRSCGRRFGLSGVRRGRPDPQRPPVPAPGLVERALAPVPGAGSGGTRLADGRHLEARAFKRSPHRDRRVQLRASLGATSARILVRIHYTPYWTVTAGNACAERDGDWTRLDVRSPGAVEVAARFSLAGLFRRDSECSG